MGNKEVKLINGKLVMVDKPQPITGLQNLPQPAKIDPPATNMPTTNQSPETGAILGETIGENKAEFKRKATGVPFVKNDPRISPKKKGDRHYKTLFFEVLSQMKTKDGRRLSEKELIKLGIVPLFEKMTTSSSPKYHKLYNDILDRIYGKSTQNIDHTTKGEKLDIPQIIGVRIIKDNE